MFKFELYVNIILLLFQRFILFERMFIYLVVFFFISYRALSMTGLMRW